MKAPRSRVRTIGAEMPGLPKESEVQFTKKIHGLLVTCGWLVHHDWSSSQVDRVPLPNGGFTWRKRRANANPGFPDIFAIHVRRGLMLAVELKREGGKATPEQEAWLTGIRLVVNELDGVIVDVWRPSDWERISRIITGE